MERAPFFCMSKEAIADMANTYMGERHHAPLHPLENVAGKQFPEERAPEPSNEYEWVPPPPTSCG